MLNQSQTPRELRRALNTFTTVSDFFHKQDRDRVISMQNILLNAVLFRKTAACVLLGIASICNTIDSTGQQLVNSLLFNKVPSIVGGAKDASLLFEDIDWFSQSRGIASIVGVLNPLPNSNHPLLPAVSWLYVQQDGEQIAGLSPTFFKFTQPTEALGLSFHGDVSKTGCSVDQPIEAYLSGCGLNSKIFAVSTTDAIANIAYTNSTSAYVVLDNSRQVVVSYSHAPGVNQSSLRGFCAHDLVVDYVGFDDDPTDNRTAHSFLMPGWGFRVEINDPNFQTIRTGVVMGQTVAPSVPGPLLPLLRSYHVVDQPGVRRWTEFYDADIDVKRDDTPNGPSSPRERDRHALCPEWRAAVVGVKMVGDEKWGLYTELDAQLIPLFARVLRVSVEATPLQTEFRAITASYDMAGVKNGYFITGIVTKKISTQVVKQYLLVLKTNGCLPLGGAPLSIQWRRLYEIPSRLVDFIESSQQLPGGNFVVVANTPLIVDDDRRLGSILTIDKNNGDIVGAYTPAPNMVTSLTDVVGGATLPNGASRLLTIGSRTIVDPADVRGYFASGLWSLQEAVECDFVELNTIEVEHDISDEARVLMSYEEPVKIVEVVRVEPKLDAEASCVPTYPCEAESMSDRLHQWSSHYDRGNDIAFLQNGDLISTGLVSGTYTSPATINPASGCADCSSSSGLNSRNMDCFMLLTDSYTDLSQSRHGWFRLLLEPEDVILSCDLHVPLLTDRGSSGFEIGYGVSAGQNVGTIAGMQILTRPNSSSPCPQQYPGGGGRKAGDRNAFLSEVTDLNTQLPLIKSMLFGKRHDYLTEGADFFRSIEDNYDLYAFDEPQNSGASLDYNAERAAAVNAEVFYDVVRDEDPRSIDEPMTVSVGFTSSSEYSTIGVDGLAIAPIHKRGLVMGSSRLTGKSNCEELAAEKLWATCIGLSPSRQLEKSLGFGGVAKSVNADGTHSYTAVGYTQHNGYVSNTIQLAGNPVSGTWQGNSGNQGLTGVVVQFDEDGNVTNTARIAVGHTACPQEQGYQPFVGNVRLQEIVAHDNDGDHVTDFFVVVGSIMLSNVNGESDEIEEREHMFVAKLDKRLELVWSKILVAAIPQELGPTTYNGKLRSVAANDEKLFVLAGEVSGIEVAPGQEAKQSFVVTIEIDAEGRTVRARKQLKPMTNRAGGSTCVEEVESTHLGGVATQDGLTAMIGHTCRLEQMITQSNGSTALCIDCASQKGDVLQWRWECSEEMYGSAGIVVYDLSTAVTEGYFDRRQIRVLSVVKSNPIDNGFVVEYVSDPCRFIQFVNSELVRITPDTVCFLQSTPENNYERGTFHGHGHLDRDCYPTPP